MSAWSYHKRGEGGRPGLRMIDWYIHKHIQDWECFFLLHSLQSEIEQTQETKSKSKLTQMNVSPNQSSPMISINPRCNPQNISKWIMQNNSIRFYQNKIWKNKIKMEWERGEVFGITGDKNKKIQRQEAGVSVITKRTIVKQSKMFTNNKKLKCNIQSYILCNKIEANQNIVKENKYNPYPILKPEKMSMYDFHR